MSAALVVPGPRPRRSGRAGKLWTYLGMLLLVLFCLAPIYWMVVSAFRRASDIFAISLVPQPVSLDNFRTVFAAGQGFLRSLLNSFVVATATTVLTLVVAVSAGYALARLEFRFKRAFMIGVVSTSMFPTVALSKSIPPTGRMSRNSHRHDAPCPSPTKMKTTRTAASIKHVQNPR